MISSSRTIQDEEGLLGVREVAARLNVGKNRVYDFVGEGMPIVDFGDKKLRFRWSSVLDWVAKRERSIKRRTTNAKKKGGAKT